MGMTALFVELIVIGATAALWVLGIVTPIADICWLGSSYIEKPPVLALGTCFVYILGIVTDRIADTLVESKGITKPMRRRAYEDGQDRFTCDWNLLHREESPHTKLLEYGRSRIRITRSCALNLALACLVQLIVPEITDRSRNLWLTAIYGSGAIGCAFAWYQLKMTEYKKVRDIAELLSKPTPREKYRSYLARKGASRHLLR